MSATPPPNPVKPSLRDLEPVPTLLRRIRAELAASFDPTHPMRISRAPGRLDVMGGIADYTGALVCEATLDRAAAVALQSRDDREVQVFSFNLYDEHQPFTLRINLNALAGASIKQLQREFAEPGRRWAAYLVGCLAILHDQKLLDLTDPSLRGVNLALHSTVPLGAGVSSSAAIEVATMINLLDHYGIRRSETGEDNTVDPMRLARLCQQVENHVVGAPCGIMDQVTSCYGQPGKLLRMVCQPHELQPPLTLPQGIRVLGINSNVRHSVGGGMYGRTRCAAFMGHKIILEKMREMGVQAGRELIADPMRGYLANLLLEDYKKYFRQFLPEEMKGSDFLQQYGTTSDSVTSVDPDQTYHVLGATDHHVFESRRIRNFVEFLEQANQTPPHTAERSVLLDKAGHLMYASHVAYREDARLGAEECDLLVDLVRQYEKAGLYGAKITGGGSGGTVAVLANQTEKADTAIAEILEQYKQKTGLQPEAFLGTSPGAWHVGTEQIHPA